MQCFHRPTCVVLVVSILLRDTGALLKQVLSCLTQHFCKLTKCAKKEPKTQTFAYPKGAPRTGVCYEIIIMRVTFKTAYITGMAERGTLHMHDSRPSPFGLDVTKTRDFTTYLHSNFFKRV